MALEERFFSEHMIFEKRRRTVALGSPGVSPGLMYEAGVASLTKLQVVDCCNRAGFV